MVGENTLGFLLVISELITQGCAFRSSGLKNKDLKNDYDVDLFKLGSDVDQQSITVKVSRMINYSMIKN